MTIIRFPATERALRRIANDNTARRINEELARALTAENKRSLRDHAARMAEVPPVEAAPKVDMTPPPAPVPYGRIVAAIAAGILIGHVGATMIAEHAAQAVAAEWERRAE